MFHAAGTDGPWLWVGVALSRLGLALNWLDME